ncbi:hypothetical protein BV22DRAFT_1061490 [Leucogyrophana mollusca]|uniref:Uncharacterized protein n=1 Tax=Leucogyrophana mollusca TaxID=85980 RepID=A0ACB8BR99_9AGAM|nr:hypothetical protein BV22DRAFT_1061490 [Leucogyrophana mollusca]
MSITPGKPRHSGIPTPGKSSGIPTPGRFRSASSVHANTGVDSDVEYMSRAFADAIKANDPAQHRASITNSSSPSSSSPKHTTVSLQSGRRSVAGRPSSVASSSAPAHNRTKTPAPAPRPSSRQSDVFGRSVSRAGRPFDVGDNVRIESLGYEGTLRYLGDIEGKPGLWAGVELSGGFAGKGKNNGTVNGKQYFICPPNCGVFVATTKLSAPTVGVNFRPSSVASSRSGRITPSYSGRITPSTSISLNNGRVTPSHSFGRTTPHSNPFSASGRITPSAAPAARARAKVMPNLGPSASQPQGQPGLEAITSGSRASKYIGLTAKQLGPRSPSNGGLTTSEYSLKAPSSPSRTSTSLDPQTRSSDSPFTTPKAVSGSRVGSYTPGLRGRPTLNTPRARVPSAVAMPPPASPGHSVSTFADGTDPQGGTSEAPPPPDLAIAGQALQDKINQLLSGKPTPANEGVESRSASELPAGPSSDEVRLQASHKEALEAQLHSLEQENAALRDAAATSAHNSANLQTAQSERDAALARVTNLEKELRTLERTVSERESKIESLERSTQQALADMDRSRVENEARLNDIQAKFETSDALVRSLKEAISVKEGAEHETDALLKAKNDEIGLLQGRLEKVSGELQQERKDLGAQIDELRQAGQETIALYEERLNASDTRRYELEDRIVFLEEQAKKAAVPMSPSAMLQRASSAAEIDNETLREQAQHLQRKISALEDSLEDVRAMSEREEVAMRERIKRFKDKEEAMKNELNEGRKTMEQVVKAESIAKGRVEEAEEALRESTYALENARAEIEILRTDIAAAGLAASGANDSSQKLADLSRQAESERSRLTEEIQDLQHQLQQAFSATREVEERFEQWKSETENKAGVGVSSSVPSFAGILTVLKGEDWQARYEEEHDALLSLRTTLEERSAELETTKKKLNRELPVNGPQESHKPPSTPTKQESAELLGLKLIVQEMQKENLTTGQRNKLLESENRLLLSETEQLRQELRILEENVEQSLLREEESLAMGTNSSSGPVSGDVQSALKEQRAKFEADLEQLRKRLTEAEMKTARVSHDLNKEISELEALVESKIYREDELEQEVERLKEKLSRHKKSSKNSLEPTDIIRQRNSASTGSTVSLDDYPQRSREDVCEICERPGHDIFTCDLLKDDAPASRGAKQTTDPSALFCEDCESHGHVASDCPHSMDVF